MDQEQLNALTQFLLNIDCLDSISKTSGFNPFDVLKIARTEIRHSNMLAWLLDPNENHGFGPRISAALISFIIRNGMVNYDVAVSLLTKKHNDIVVKREWKSIDILIESREGKYVICIENKVDTQDHSNQLNRYYETIQETESYQDFVKIFLYLTPDGLTPNNDKNNAWRTIAYRDMINIIQQEQEKANLPDDVRTFVNQYLEILRRETMEDTNLAQLCRKIYAEHKQALDLIFEYRSDIQMNVRDELAEWIRSKDEMILDEKRGGKSICRFQTKAMNAIIPESQVKSEWNTYSHYYYELKSEMAKDELKYHIQFVVNSNNLPQEEKQRLSDLCRTICNKYNKKKTWSDDWTFITPVSSDKHTITAESLENENFREQLAKNLDALWKDVKAKTEDYLKSLPEYA